MPYTDEELEQLAEKAENFDPSEAERVIDATPIREITEATEQIQRAQARQWEAVQVARARGISWNMIAAALGVSRQAARQRFAGDAPAPASSVVQVRARAGRRTMTRAQRKASPERPAAKRNPKG